MFTTLSFVFAGLVLPKMMVEPHLEAFGFLLILAGVPHGASDFYVARELSQNSGKRVTLTLFLIGYLMIMALYSAVWWFVPQLAFWIFILVSAYHFGQSNWSFLKFRNGIVKNFTFLFWGVAILGVPVILYFDQASIIVLEMTGVQLVMENAYRAAFIFLLIFGVTGTLIFLYNSGVLSAKLFQIELGKFFLLMLLFFTTPLLVGFGVYFVMWHSLTSILDQVKVVKSNDQSFGFKAYIRSTIPLTLVAFTGLSLFYFFFNGYFDKGQNLGFLFIFIAVITIPHAVLMEWLYRVGKPVLEKVNPL